jgi:hypothetical protein
VFALLFATVALAVLFADIELAAVEAEFAALLAAAAAELAAAAAWLAAAFIAFAAEFIALAAPLLVLAAVFVLAVSPPQAIPNAPSAKRVESAIIFFMSKWTLLSFSKNILTYFYLLPPFERHCPRTVKFWNNRQYSHPAYISQLLTRRKTGLNKNLL